MNESNGHYLNTREAAAWLGLSPRTLDRYRVSGEGTGVPPVRVPGAVPARRPRGMGLGAQAGLDIGRRRGWTEEEGRTDTDLGRENGPRPLPRTRRPRAGGHRSPAATEKTVTARARAQPAQDESPDTPAAGWIGIGHGSSLRGRGSRDLGRHQASPAQASLARTTARPGLLTAHCDRTAPGPLPYRQP